MKKYTLLIAHPDDELLWCWPVLRETKRIVCASSDLYNPERAWCKERRHCLEEVGRRLNIDIFCFDANSEFYRMPTRGGELKGFAAELIRRLTGPVFTHNAFGEYGHLDHILCHQIAMASGLEVWTSDMAQEINWLPIHPWFKATEPAELDMLLFDSLKQIYDDRGCWTWSFEIQRKCRIGRVS